MVCPCVDDARYWPMQPGQKIDHYSPSCRVSIEGPVADFLPVIT